MAPKEHPAEAGTIVFDMHRIRPLRILLLVATLAILVGLAVSDHKLVPLAGMIVAICALTGCVGGAVKYFTTQLWALCEHGVVTRRAGRFELVPWSAVAGVERLSHEGHVAYEIQTDRAPLVLSPAALGTAETRRAIAFIEQRRSRRGRRAGLAWPRPARRAITPRSPADQPHATQVSSVFRQ